MSFGRTKRVIALILCLFVLGTLINAKEALASTCYNHDDKRIVTTNPTCGKSGRKEYHCSKCGYLVRTETIKATGNHSWGSWVTDKAATCEADGTKHRTCSVCKKQETGTITKLGHNVQGQKKTVAATCAKEGYTAIVCSRCGKEMSRTTIAKKNHSWGSWVTDKAATCENDGTKHRNCTVCGTKETGTITKLGHSTSGSGKTVDSTCTSTGYRTVNCSRCGKELSRTTIAKKNHSWGSWVTDKAATCENDGTKHRNCTVCGTKETGTITKLGHSTSGSGKTVDSTCTSTGYRTVNCSRCGKELSRATIAKKDHTWGSWVTDKAATCEADGTRHRNCTVCNAKDTGTITKLGHNVQGSKKIVNATCTATGYEAIVCSRCGKEMSRTTIAKKDHTWGSWVTDKAATCEADGTRHRNCTVCNAKDTGTITKLGHNVQGSKKIVNATCTATGYEAIVCSRCGKEMSRTTIAKKDHTWGSWVTDKAATCEADGTRHRNCTVCNAKDTGTITKLGHNVQGTKKTVNATCTKDGYTAIVCSRCGKEVSKTTIKAPGHDWDKWVTTKNATCEADGSKYHKCKVCGLQETATITKLGHNVQGTKKTVNATCTKDGYTAIVCSRCGKEVSKTTIKAPGHDWDKWVTTKDATCEADGSKYHKCKTCGTQATATITKLGHNVQGQKKTVDSTCTKEGYTAIVCSRCGKEVSKTTIQKKEHDFDKWVVTKNATCEEDGSRYHKCKGCGLQKTEVINKLGHNVQGQKKTVDSTCTKEGYTAIVCSRCGKEVSKTTIQKKEHDFDKWVVTKNATCEEDGSRYHKCKDCGLQKTEVINKLGHNVQGQLKTVSATCTKDGYTAVVCSNCGKEMGRKVITAPGHKWSKWDASKNPATCTKDGAKYRTCSVCNTTERETVKKLGHNVQGQIRKVEPTCEKDGYHGIVCSRCGELVDGKILVSPGHDWSEWKQTNPTCEEDGVKERTCSICQKVESHKISKLGHNVQGQIRTVAPTYTTDGYTVLVCSRCGKEMGQRTYKYSDVHLCVNENFPGGQVCDVTFLMLPNDTISGKELKRVLTDYFLMEYPGHYLKGFKTADGKLSFNVSETIETPHVDTTLYAVWGDNEYDIYYRNGFTGELEYTQHVVGNKATLEYIPEKVAGYTFVGWVKAKSPNASMWSWGDGVGTHPFACKPTYTIINRSVTLTDDMNLYTCFEETEAPDDGRILVCYSASGGVGGPADDYYSPGETYKVSKEEPTKDGFVFVGWSNSVFADRVDYHGGDEYTSPVIDNKVVLFAVWVADTTNDLKHDLQKRFKNLMPDWYFECEYESSHWEKVNDHCYFAIKTTNNGSGDNKWMSSTVFIINYSNGEWKLEALGVSQGIFDAIKFNILTSNDNFWGRVKVVGFDVMKTACSIFVPGMGAFISGVDFLNAFQNFVISWDTNDKATARFALAVTDYLVAATTSLLKEKNMSDAEISDVIVNSYDMIKDTSKKIVLNDYRDDLGDVLLFTYNTWRVADSVNTKAAEQEVRELEKEMQKAASRDLAEELSKLDGIDVIDYSKSISQFKLGLLDIAVSQTVDTLRAMNKYRDCDPFGDFDVAIGRYKEELGKQHFNDGIIEDFDGIIQSIFDKYYDY